ncbi:hypothetical protein SISNIDRAFT_470077 [Sistotremastrum niveocremeum HHB9708]|uniref:Uncharacterized protein n=1 Tax=Sistotremastrum niveocremeum HHB9708 TaxID=1314777 RepID=A0A164PDX0_9AGAM|nr:hypothetical protein SISNIDRAFT_470077 [Sistotremastrum niveocremeum HHB9708]
MALPKHNQKSTILESHITKWRKGDGYRKELAHAVTAWLAYAEQYNKNFKSSAYQVIEKLSSFSWKMFMRQFHLIVDSKMCSRMPELPMPRRLDEPKVKKHTIIIAGMMRLSFFEADRLEPEPFAYESFGKSLDEQDLIGYERLTRRDPSFSLFSTRSLGVFILEPGQYGCASAYLRADM